MRIKSKPPLNYLTGYFISFCNIHSGAHFSLELVGFYSSTNETASWAGSDFTLTIILSVQAYDDPSRFRVPQTKTCLPVICHSWGY